MTDAALKRLCAYDWPGNARQLENIIERAFAMMAGDVLDEAQILFHTSPVRDVESLGKPPLYPAVAARAPPSSKPGIATLEEETLKHIRTVLAAHDGNQVAAARALGIKPHHASAPPWARRLSAETTRARTRYPAFGMAIDRRSR